MKKFSVAQLSLLPVFAALLGCGLILGFAKPAEARMRFCNYSGEKLYVSWAWKEVDGDWVSDGHYGYDPGECRNVYSAPLRSRIYYYYAEKAGATPTHSTSTKANRKFCVSSKAYEIVYDGTSRPYYDRNYTAANWKRTCSELGESRTNTTYRLRDFRQINTGSLGYKCTVTLKTNGSSSYSCGSDGGSSVIKGLRDLLPW